ncbi:MAG: transcriptional repressor [Sphingomonadaceae bacterium]
MAASHIHLEAGTPALAAAAAEAAAREGLTWTGLRSDVFAALSDADRPISAYDIADAVSARLGRRIAANSIYRILDLFVEHNLALRVESRNAYVVNPHPACRHHCIFLICEQCGAITHLDDDQLGDRMTRKAEVCGFRASRVVLEILGLCQGCNA